MPFIKPLGDTFDGNLTTINKTFTGAINELDSDIGDKTYDYNEIVTDGESLTSSINKITTYLHNEDYSEYRYYPSWQNITKQSGVLTYNITQDENSNSPYIISDYTSISNDILDFEIINPSTRKAIFKQGSILPISSNRVKVINYNNTTGVITLNFEPKENFRVVFLMKYTNKDLPNGKKIEAENGEVIISNTDEASEIQYSNSTSGLISTDTQSAIDEVTEKTKYNSFGTVQLPTIIKNADGTITIDADGVFNFCKSANGDDLIIRKTLAGTTLTPTDNTVNYLYADYNSGNPLYDITTSQSMFLTNATYCPVARIIREGNTLHFEEYDQYGVALANKMLYKDININGAQRQSGLILSTTTIRVATVSSGNVSFGVQNYNCETVTSGTVGNMFEYYLVSGVWNKSSNQSSFDSTYYSDGTNRQTMTANRYVAKYFWRDVGSDNEIYYIYGNQYTTASGALAEVVPTAPSIMTAHSIYVGKIVIQQGASLGVAYPRLWEGAIATASATSHEDLTNILQAGIGVANGHISDGTQTIAGQKTFSNDIYFKNIYINGNIVQQGTAYETHAEKLYTTKNEIITRDGATVGLSSGEYTGFRAKLYDGTNDGQLIFDKDGVARVGDVGSTQAIATREDSPVNGKVPIWNSTTMRFETSNSPTTIAGYGITDGAIQGIAYSNLENNVKIVQGVPAGGKMYLGATTQTGAIKIKLPKNKTSTMFKFHVRMNGYSTGGKQSNSEYVVKGFNDILGFGNTADTIATCQVTVIKDNPSNMSPVFYFCTGATEDYLIIGEITDTHVYKTVIVDNVEIHFTGIANDWSKDWAISLVTTLETLTSQYKVAVTPSLNATHLGGVQESTSATANTIVKRDANGAITNSQYKLSALNTAPASATATGTLGEIRCSSGGIYMCIGTDTWRKSQNSIIYAETLSGLTSSYTNSGMTAVDAGTKYIWRFQNASNICVLESTHNLYSGNSFYSLVTGATVATVTANSVFSFRLGDSVIYIKFDTSTGAVSYSVASGTVTSIAINRTQHSLTW